MGTLDGQTALITGCGRKQGIGRGIALTLAAAGADLAISDIAEAGSPGTGETESGDDSWLGVRSLAAEVEALGRRCHISIGDVSKKEDAERMISESVAGLGKLDILVNNAAAPRDADRNFTWEVPVEAFERVLKVNTVGTFLMSGAFIRHLKSRDAATGRIINISSGAGRRGIPQRGAYCSSKFAVIGLTQVMALELASSNVTVNAICPGAIETSRRSSVSTDEKNPIAISPTATPWPIQRVGNLDDIGRTVLFLAEPAASFITGQALSIDGGMIML